MLIYAQIFLLPTVLTASQSIYTEANIPDPSALEMVEACVRKLSTRLRKDASTALVIEPPSEDTEGRWGYYFVDHANRTLFWQEEFELPVHELDGVPSIPQLRKNFMDTAELSCDVFPRS